MIDYDGIRADNIREYGEGTRHLDLLGRLYTDRTHFLFELLQNAEDAGATKICFNLFDDRLEVVHNGRDFNEQDVRGVCGVGEGTKAEDFMKIGKFGVGFKSVYAYTATPEVHSGGESFKIENYVRPYKVPPVPANNPGATLFIFPFDTENVLPETACREIGVRLRNLSARTLLFLRKIEEIEYRLPNATEGAYLRDVKMRGSARQVTVIGQNNGKEEEENWLIFERSVPVPDNSERVRVEAAFRLVSKSKDGKKFEWIEGYRKAPLIVYFPTEKETNLGFLVQGPYRTTPARDNIPKDDAWNKTLVKETAALIGDILPEIKNLGLLSVSFLEALPIRAEDFPPDSMFYPIAEAVRDKLIKEELLPGDDGSFVSAENAKLARSSGLRKLLSQRQLGQLFQSTATIKWLTGEITQDRTPDLLSYLSNELKVEAVTSEFFARKLDHSFLSVQPAEWFVDFYEYLSDQEALWRPTGYKREEGSLRRKPIIRCEDGHQRPPFDELGNPAVFIPIESNLEYPIVCKSIYKNESVSEFMKKLGLTVPDICVYVLNDIIPIYQNNYMICDGDHRKHVSIIANAIKLEESPHYSKMMSALKDTAWALATNAKTGEQGYRKPACLFLQSPELQIFFEKNENIWFLSEEMEKTDWKKLGVRTEPIINCCGLYTERDHHAILYSSHGWHKRGIDGFDPNTSIDELEHALIHITLRKAVYIWNELLPPLIRFLHGRYETATHQNYDNVTPYECDSKLCEMLKNHAWLPVSSNEFKKPSECTVAALAGELKRNNELAEALGIQSYPEKLTQEGSESKSEEERKREYAAELGFSPYDIELIKDHPDKLRQFLAELAAPKASPVFPTRPVSNPERRQENVRERLNDSPNKVFEKREISVRTTSSTIDAKTWLREQYTNDDDQMVCQICKEEMPFRKRDGTYYFEKQEVLSKDYLPKEYEAQYLALCPLCAAKYKEFIITVSEAMAVLKDKIINAEDIEIPIFLGNEKTSIRFVETHLHDLQTILNEAG